MSVIAPTELLVAREALLTIPDLMALAATPAILDTSEIAIAARVLLCALLALAVVTGLEVGEAALMAAVPVHTLCLALMAATLDALRPPFAATTAALHALSLTAATTFDLGCWAFTTATATFHALRLLAATTAASALGFLAAAALGLRVSAMAAALSTALVGLR